MTSDQQFLVRELINAGEGPASVSNESNHVHATDTLNWNSSGAFLGPTGSQTAQTYRLQTSPGNCYDRTIAAVAQKLVSVTDGPVAITLVVELQRFRRPYIPNLSC